MGTALRGYPMKAFRVAPLLILLVTLQCSCAVSPADCNATEPLAGKALDLINKGRRNGYLFQLLRVADAHLDKVGIVAVYYLVLDVKESDCPVQSRKHWDDCEPAVSRRPSDIVIGQCKVIATACLNESQDLRVNDFNCTTSSVSSALANTKDSPVLFDFFEDTELYRTQANKALETYTRKNDAFASFLVDQVERVARVRGGERTNYYVDFSVRNCSSHHFPRDSNVFGFCRADLSYDVGTSDMEAPKDIVINCDVFNLKEHGNISDEQPHLDHLQFEHSPTGKPSLKPSGSRNCHHPHKPHKLNCPPPLEDKSHSDRPQFLSGARPLLPPSKCYHLHFGTNGTHTSPHNQSSSKNHSHGHGPHEHHPHGHRPHEHHRHEHHPHEHHPHGHCPHEHYPHGHRPHEHHPHGHRPHEHHPHGHHPHEHHCHGHRPHKHHPHGHRPHERHLPHPHSHDFHDHEPCGPPTHSQGPQDHHRWGHGPPPRHSEERGPGKRHFLFKWRQIGHVYQLPPLKKGEVLPLPEANFPSISLPNYNIPLKPEMQPFPQSASTSCPGMFKSDFPQVLKFFAHTAPKENLSFLKNE